MLKNCKAMAQAMLDRGYQLVSGSYITCPCLLDENGVFF